MSNQDLSDCASSSTGLGGPGASPQDAGDGDRESGPGQAGLPDFFESRGVLPDVAEARPYIYYSLGDSALVREHWRDSPRFASRIANQSSGVVIPRYAPRWLGLAQVPAELRPDEAVVTSSNWQFHGDDPESAELVFPRSGKPLPTAGIHAPDEMSVTSRISMVASMFRPST